MSKLRVLDLFSGIGGFSLGLERTGGFSTVAFCEIDPFCRRVLAKHWPEVSRYEDVRTLTAVTLARDGITVDAICGGFPCQDVSLTGTLRGLDGERSGLWREYARLVGELRPRFVIVENVAALLGNGMGRVLGDLAAVGYDAEWHCVPASYVGAPHVRDRVWIVAHAAGERMGSGWAKAIGTGAPLAMSEGGNGALSSRLSWRRDWRDVSRDLHRMGDGFPDAVHRGKALGNAVVPQIPELIGRAILAALSQERAAA